MTKFSETKIVNSRIPTVRFHLLAFGALVVACAALLAASILAGPPQTKPDVAASRAAFLQIYRVLTSPRCQNCHPAGDAPLQGDDSHVHLQYVKRGKDGHGVYGMRCDTCHQATNLPGAHMPPGNPKWALPPPELKMVFVGRSPAELCKQIKDPKQNGNRDLQALFDHIAKDDLVGWGWEPGDGRTLPPLTRPETVAQLKIWIDGGAVCPE
jgi:mono/diheme cytochrome c family protein